MSEKDDAVNQEAAPAPFPRRWLPTLTLVLDIVAPLVIFYGLRSLGVSVWPALVLGGIAPVISITLTWARHRHLDPTAIFVLVALILSVVVALFTADPRALVARESWLTGAIGVWMIVTLSMSRPFLLDIIIKMSPQALGIRGLALWQKNRVFRRWLRVTSIAWGTAFLLDAVIRVAMAFTIPLDVVPLASVLILIGLLVLAQGGTLVYGRRTGALKLYFAKS